MVASDFMSSGVFFLTEGSSAGISFEEKCYGMDLLIPSTYTPPIYNGPLYFTPSKGSGRGSRKILMDNGEVSCSWCYYLLSTLFPWHTTGRSWNMIQYMNTVGFCQWQSKPGFESDSLFIKCLYVVHQFRRRTHASKSDSAQFAWQIWRRRMKERIPSHSVKDVHMISSNLRFWVRKLQHIPCLKTIFSQKMYA